MQEGFFYKLTRIKKFAKKIQKKLFFFVKKDYAENMYKPERKG